MLMGNDKKDVKEIKEILEVISREIPALLTSITDVLYGKDQAGKYAEAVAGFYKALKDGGMTDEQAFELTQQYMSSLNIPSMIGKAVGEGKKKIVLAAKEGEDIGAEIEKKIKEKLKKNIEED